MRVLSTPRCRELAAESSNYAERGVIRQTETGAIDTRDLRKVYAIESQRDAIAELQTRFPGLRGSPANGFGACKATTQLRWPEGEPLEACRARLLNLDLNASLECRIRSNQLTFPVVELIKKIATIQADTDEPPTWKLFLTLDARINWADSDWFRVTPPLKANFETEPAFAEATRAFVGDDLSGHCPAKINSYRASSAQTLANAC